MTTTQPTPSALDCCNYLASIGLPVPANTLVIPLHGEKVGSFKLATFDHQTQWRYFERVQYLHTLVEAVGAQITEETVARISLEFDLSKQLATPVRPETTHSYAAFRPCGCMYDAALDAPNTKRQTVTEVYNWLLRGLEIRYLRNEEVAKHITLHCPHKVEQLAIKESA